MNWFLFQTLKQEHFGTINLVIKDTWKELCSVSNDESCIPYHFLQLLHLFCNQPRAVATFFWESSKINWQALQLPAVINATKVSITFHHGKRGTHARATNPWFTALLHVFPAHRSTRRRHHRRKSVLSLRCLVIQRIDRFHLDVKLSRQLPTISDNLVQ